MARRNIINSTAKQTLKPYTRTEIGDLRIWLVEQATTYRLTWLLAYLDDGVLWGKFENGQLLTAETDVEANKVCPVLRIETLQQIRLFNEDAELMLWRSEADEWKARLIQETNEASTEFTGAIDESYMLWGTEFSIVKHNPHFTLARDGAQGLQHAVPFGRSQDFKRNRPLRLKIRHYLTKDETGFTRIATSRLLALKLEG